MTLHSDKGKRCDTKDITTVVFPTNLLGNVLINKTKQQKKINKSLQVNKPKQLNTMNTIS